MYNYTSIGTLFLLADSSYLNGGNVIIHKLYQSENERRECKQGQTYHILLLICPYFGKTKSFYLSLLW